MEEKVTMKEERKREETQDKRNFQGMFPLPCACCVLRPHPLLSHQGSSTIGGTSTCLHQILLWDSTFPPFSDQVMVSSIKEEKGLKEYN